jgi:DhnA-type fructose-1,6-bisphosphate aldolase and related enzymes
MIVMALNNKISLVFPMAYPGPGVTNSVLRGEADEGYLLNSLKKVLDDPYFGAVEVTQIKDSGIREKAVELIKKSGKTVLFSAQPVQLSHKEDMVPETDISTINENGRKFALKRIFSLIDEAYEYGAEGFAFISGRDVEEKSLRSLAVNALISSIHEMCEYSDSKAGELGQKPMNMIIEQFDRIPEAGFKNQLVGPSSEAVEIAKQVRYVYGHMNFGLMYDLSHMPIIMDSTGNPETSEVLRGLSPYLMHIHVGNCVTCKEDKKYGDSHVRMDYANGAVNRDMMASFVRVLKEIGYKGIVGFEVSPVKDELSEVVINIHKTYFDEARNRTDVNYAIGKYAYTPREFTPEKLFDMITDIRVSKPYVIADEAKKRKKRESLTLDGKLVILACDHPGRHVTSVGSNPVAMGIRTDYLSRILRVLSSDEIDGVMTTPDIMDDLFIINYIYGEYCGKSFLDNKVLVGCMNRSGLAGFQYEMDDMMTAYDAATMHEMGFDASKILLRLDKDKHSKESIKTLGYCAKAINECNKYNLPIMIEPLPVELSQDGTSYKIKMNKESLIQTIGVASALGSSSRNHWIKIPYVDGYDMVVKSTTMPILMLGGASEGSPINTIENFERGMGAGRNVRGALVGRNVLYPGNDDPMAVAIAISRVVHKNYSAAEAVSYLAGIRNSSMDFISKFMK